ncbi:MAG: serine/threonine protein kinase [Myxococcales bacterium]|nr:serine/threonine protein kinase [Myxococcales bacterium]
MSERPRRIGDYEIEGDLGAGGMAKVYRARHVMLDTHHAIKVLDPSYRENPDARQRFLDEARIQAKHLDHPNIVKVTNIVATAEHAALVMELIEGKSLEAQIATFKTRPAEIKRIMFAVLDAVGYAHAAGIIHRDLKPANVLLASKGSQLIPKVTDFGIAKVTSPDDAKGIKKSTAAGARMGTLSYMSPEQIRRAKDVTPRSDIFALGAMLYEMATGEMAFGGDSDYDVMDNIIKGQYEAPQRRYADIDPVIASVIAKALAPDPAARFASCDEMAAALRGETAVGTKPVVTRPAVAKAVPAAPAPAARSSRGLVLALVGGALVLGGGAVVLAMRGSDPAETTGASHVSQGSALASNVAAVSLDASAPPPDVAVPPPDVAAPPPSIAAPPAGIAAPPAGIAAAPTGAGGGFAANPKLASLQPTTRPAPATPLLPPKPASTRPVGEGIAFCVGGFDPAPSICELKRSAHRAWHRHGYLVGRTGQCYECWDEEDSDCETAAPTRTGFTYLGGECRDKPPALRNDFQYVHPN